MPQSENIIIARKFVLQKEYGFLTQKTVFVQTSQLIISARSM